MATFWTYVRIQLICFVFGIIGPIFLVVYFSAQPDPTVRPMWWVGLFVTAADVLIALVVTDHVMRSKPGKQSDAVEG